MRGRGRQGRQYRQLWRRKTGQMEHGEVEEHRGMAHGDDWQPALDLGTESCGFRPPPFPPEVIAGG